MKEDSNQAIAVNTVVLYVKLIVNSVCGLLTTRFALKALGASDFGLFSVVGGVITLISMLNVIMLATSNRFIATAIGKGNVDEINTTFNVNLLIHVLIALLTILVAFPVGDWYINHHVNFDGDISLAIKVYHITVIGAIISFVGVPYNGVLYAHERFLYVSVVDVISHVLKLLGVVFLMYYVEDKLVAYAVIVSVLSAFPTFAFLYYSLKVFPSETMFRFVTERKRYRAVLSFSVWVGYGAIAYTGKTQGSALIINKFFNTVMNTALGVANTINSFLHMISGSLTKSIAPQITKSYVAGNYQRCESLVILASKISFLLFFLVSSPFLVAPDYLINLWLGEVPAFSSVFLIVLIFDALIGALNAGIPELIFASGRIRDYQLIVNSLYLLSVVVGFFVVRSGLPAYSLQITFVVFSIVIFIVRQVVVNRVVKFDNKRIIQKSYIPSILVAVLFLPFFAIRSLLHPIIMITIAVLYLCLITYFIGLSKSERIMVIDMSKRVINRLVKR